MSESPLSAVDVNDDNTHGIGIDLYKNPYNEPGCISQGDSCLAEAAAIQDCSFHMIGGVSCGARKTLGTDSTGDDGFCKLKKVKDYGSYAIYVGNDVNRLPLLSKIGFLGSGIISGVLSL